MSEVNNFLIGYGDACDFVEGYEGAKLLDDKDALVNLMDGYRFFLDQLHESLVQMTEDDILFAPFHTPNGSTFFSRHFFDAYDDEQLADHLLKKGGVIVNYTAPSEGFGKMIFLHGNFGSHNCFQGNGKYDYRHLSRIMDTDLIVMGRFEADFFTEDGDEVEINETIYQEYSEGQLEEGWEQEKTSSGVFAAEDEVDEDYIGSNAISKFYADDENVDVDVISKWLDPEFVAENTGQ